MNLKPLIGANTQKPGVIFQFDPGPTGGLGPD